MRKTCLNEIYKLAKQDKRVVFFGSDIASGTLSQFREEMPDRFFMEGVSEANIVGVMSGLAMNGKIPYLNTIAVFLTRRCYEQIFLDAAMHDLKIRLVGSGGGLVYAPLGPTHLAFEDISLMRAIPNMTIVAPCDSEEMKRLMPQTLDREGPMYIRLGKGGDPIVSSPDKDFRIGKATLMREGADALIITTGVTLKMVLDAAAGLKNKGIEAAVLHMHTIKPIDSEAVMKAARKVKAIVTVEENSIAGGLGSAVSEIAAEAAFSPAKRFARLALPDAFPAKYGSQEQLMDFYGLTTEKIISSVGNLLKR
ncbi:MAG: transketolase C-terminal domain-containing protein [Candidatus Omnitrophica bacterium]|nr:transketolase C-terminal domain-containing protein [Candidatus Omnitrophota bacterium]